MPIPDEPVLPPGEWSLDAADVLLNPAVEEPFPDPVAPPAQVPAKPDAPPPDPAALLEALLFAGGPPLSAAAAAAALRVPPDFVPAAVDGLNRKYKSQRRPYAVRSDAAGYTLAVFPHFAGIAAKLAGGPKEARLTQPAVDTLALVAYRQPVTRAELDALRGADSAGPLRQLVRLGLAAVTRRAAAGADAAYGTTPRFLEVFGLTSPDDLPRVGEAKKL